MWGKHLLSSSVIFFFQNFILSRLLGVGPSVIVLDSSLLLVLFNEHRILSISIILNHSGILLSSWFDIQDISIVLYDFLHDLLVQLFLAHSGQAILWVSWFDAINYSLHLARVQLSFRACLCLECLLWGFCRRFSSTTCCHVGIRWSFCPWLLAWRSLVLDSNGVFVLVGPIDRLHVASHLWLDTAVNLLGANSGNLSDRSSLPDTSHRLSEDFSLSIFVQIFLLNTSGLAQKRHSFIQTQISSVLFLGTS